jgi:hypothetical protein
MKISGDVYSIAELSDSGGVYKITNDKFCKGYKLKPFISGFESSDFELEKMSPQQFCETFIMVR